MRVINGAHACVRARWPVRSKKMAELILSYSETNIRCMIVDHGISLADVSYYLQQRYPGVRGLSIRSARRFCSSRGIHYRSNVGDDELDEIVRSRVRVLGHSYGRRSLQGSLRAEGIRVSQRRIGRSLQRTFPLAHSQRAQTLGRLLNPIPYRAEYFGEKIHLDQNEKLVMYGIVHVIAVDGYSRKIVGFATMPRKNPITIYREVYRPLLFSHGIWNQLRTDHGTEFALVSTVQQYLSSHRLNQRPSPVLQTTSRENLRAERLWPEVNSRINYPIKAVLVRMETEELIDMRDSLHKFSVSWITIRLAASPVAAFVNAWNSHTIPGRRGGIPDVLAARAYQISLLTPSQVPSVHEAVQLHESTNRRLTRESMYGVDPLAMHPALQQLRERDFFHSYPSMEVIFSDILHGNGEIFQAAILFFITLCLRFSELTRS